MTEIQTKLFSLQDVGYRDFCLGLTPGQNKQHMIGVRIPHIRALAKELYGSSAADKFLTQLPHLYFEENHLHAFLISLINDKEQLLLEIQRFLPYIDNWAICDSFSPCFFKKQPPQLEHIDQWLASDHTYSRKESNPYRFKM